MSRIKLPQENPQGLHQRYVISNRDGEPTDPRAVYFVLRLDQHGDDDRHTAACRQAALAYAQAIRNQPWASSSLPTVARELQSLVEQIEEEIKAAKRLAGEFYANPPEVP